MNFRDEFAQDDGGKRPIDRRNGGCGVMVDNKLYVWGGQTEDIIDGERESQDLPRPSDPFLDVFDMSTRTWTRQQTFSNVGTTSIPVHHGLGSSMVYDSHRHKMYLFGGWKRRRFDSNLFALSLENFHWTIIEPKTKEIKPAPRYNTEIFIHNDRVNVFGGVGANIVINGQKLDPGAEWISAAPDGSYGWCNDHLEFDLNSKCWTSPLNKDDNRPPPLGGHRIAKFDSHRAVLFGGKGPPGHVVNGRSNDVWILDLVNMKWKGPYTPLSPDQPWPRPVRFFTLTPLLDPDSLVSNDDCSTELITLHQKLLLLWGKALYPPITDEDCHKSTWLMEIVSDDIIWTEIVIKEKPRAWHIALAYHPYPTSCPTDCEVVVFGGNKHVARDTGPRNAVSDTCIIQLGVPCLQKLCIHNMTEYDYSDSLPPKLRQDVSNYMIATKEPIPVITVGLK